MFYRGKKRQVGVYVMAAMLAFTLFFSTLAFAGEPVEIKVLSLNDFHGALLEQKDTPGAAKLATFLQQERLSNPKGTILVSAGDMFQGSVRSNILRGKPVVDMMNQMGFVAMALGNHEFDWGMDAMREQIQGSHFKWVAANIRDKNTGGSIPNTTPYTIVKANGINVGIIGMTTPETAYTSSIKVVSKFDFIEPKLVLGGVIEDARKAGAQVVIVISHLGSSPGVAITGEVVELADFAGSLDAIVSGHTHEKVAGKVNGIPVVQALTRGKYVGEIKLYYSPDKGKVVFSTVRTLAVDPSKLTANRKMEKTMERYAKKAKVIEQTVLAETKRPLVHDRHTFSLLGEFFTDAVRKEMQVDVAFANGGGLRRTLEQGRITLGDLYEVLPFDNQIMTMQLTGQQIIDVLDYGIANKTYGYMQFSGLQVQFDAQQPKGSRVIDVRLLDGRKLELNGLNTVAAADFLADGGDGYVMFKESKYIVNSNKVLRDVLADALKSMKVLDVNSDKRLIETGKVLQNAA